MMDKRAFLLLALVFLIALSLRLYDCTNPSYPHIDEALIGQASVNYWHNGQFEPAHWEHPPLKQIIPYISLHLFGDNPYGWRAATILFGSAVAALTFLFALGISGCRKTAFLAGVLIATDPLHILLSRHAFEEIYCSAFFLAAVVLFVWHRQRSSWLMLSALFVGCAMATKWYYFSAWLLLILLALYENKNYCKPANICFICSAYLLIPLSVYTLVFYNWFGRGYSFTEFIEFVTNVFTSMQQYTVDNYQTGLVFISHLSAGEWFTSPIIVGDGRYFGDGTGAFILAVNNLPIWILTIPSIITLLIIAARRKSLPLALPALFFCSTYMMYLFVKRPAFLYSAAPLLAYAFTAIACTIAHSAERYGVRIYYGALALILAWNMYLYPLATHKRVNAAPYSFILKSKDIKIR
jgi:dolichyl-phosphate-mannose--protein O-mannosyl transferase